MRAVCAADYTHEVHDLQIIEIPKPSPKPHQVLVKVHAAGANPVDLFVIAGLMMKAGWKLTFPFVPGYEFSGVIEEVGENVSDFHVGDAVFGLNWGRSNHDSLEGDQLGGCFAEYIAISAKKVCVKPPSLSFETAACISMVGTAAYQTVFQCGKVGPGSRVLILGGSTSVGAMAIQLCKNNGAFVATTCSGQSVQYVSQFHPDVIVVYDKEKWYNHRDCHHFDFVLDVAGAATTLEILKTSDHLISVGAAFVSLVNPSVGLIAQGHPPFSYARFYCLHQNTSHQQLIASKIADGELHLPIMATHAFTLEGVHEMIYGVKSGKSHGKHVLKFV